MYSLYFFFGRKFEMYSQVVKTCIFFTKYRQIANHMLIDELSRVMIWMEKSSSAAYFACSNMKLTAGNYI